jgi:hypothetical protein
MFKPQTAAPGRVGFFSLFDLPHTIFNTDVLKKLGDAMSRTGITGDSPIDSGYVYLGQFISHDISKRAPPPAGHEFMPAGELKQQRTPELDLDNVYGDGFYDRSIAVDETTGKMLLGRVVDSSNKPGSFDDLPRWPDVSARIGDDRDDENLLIAQLHLQFLKLHNLLVDRLPTQEPPRTPKQVFDEARRRLVLLYQDVVLYDFLPTVIDRDIWDQVVSRKKRRLWRPVRAEMARMPVEFAAAAFRFAHAMVRPTYAINDRRSLGLGELFAMTGAGTNNFEARPGLPDSLVVDWRLFFSGLCPVDELPFPPNKALPIDPTVAVLTQGGSLAELDLGTGNRSLMAAAQDIVAHIQRAHPKLGLNALTRQQLNPIVRDSKGAQVPLLSLLGGNDKAADSYGFSRKSPLWYYILCEAYAKHRGDRLGPLGSQIVAETLHALVDLASSSVLHEDVAALETGIEPTGEAIDGRRHYRMIDLLKAVGPQSRKFEATVSELKSSPSSAPRDNVLKLQNVA